MLPIATMLVTQLTTDTTNVRRVVLRSRTRSSAATDSYPPLGIASRFCFETSVFRRRRVALFRNICFGGVSVSLVYVLDNQ